MEFGTKEHNNNNSETSQLFTHPCKKINVQLGSMIMLYFGQFLRQQYISIANKAMHCEKLSEKNHSTWINERNVGYK